MLDKLKITGRGLTTRFKKPEPVVVKEKLFDVFGGLLDFSSNKLSNEKTISTKILKANVGWVYVNNDVIAKEVSKMEFELFSVGLSGGEIVYNQINSHPLLDLLDKPNSTMTKSDMLYLTQSHKKLTGDSFWLKIRNGRQIVGLMPLQPDKVELKLGNATDATADLVEGYIYKDAVDGKQITINYERDDIIHLKAPNPSNPFRGYGAVEAAADVIDLDNLTTKTTRSFFEKGAISNFVLTTDAKLTTDQIKRLNAEMRQMYAGANNAYKTMILGGGLKPEDISYSNKDMQMLDQLTWYRDKIMSMFGNTKASLGIIDDVNRASHESSMLEWKRTTVKPEMDAIINILNEYLVPEFGQNLILGYCDPVPEDRSDDITEVTELYPAGIITLNEARELIDMEEVEGGDEFYQKPVPIIQDPNAQAQDKPKVPAEEENPNEEN